MSAALGRSTHAFKVPGSRRAWQGAIIIVMVLGLALVLFAGTKNLIKLASLYRERTAARVQVEALQAANSALSRQIQDLRANPQAVEPIARRELGLVRPGETVYRFLPPAAAPTPGRSPVRGQSR